MRALFLLRSVHRRANRLFLRVHVSLRDVHVAVSCEIGQGPRVHVRRPPRQASMAERIEFKRCELNILLSRFFPENTGGFGEGLQVLFLQL